MEIIVESGVVSASRKPGYQMVLLVDWESKTARVTARHRTEGTPFAVRNGLVSAFRINSYVKAPVAKIRYLFRELNPEIRAVAEAFEKRWDGNNMVGAFPNAEEEKRYFEDQVESLNEEI